MLLWSLSSLLQVPVPDQARSKQWRTEKLLLTDRSHSGKAVQYFPLQYLRTYICGVSALFSRPLLLTLHIASKPVKHWFCSPYSICSMEWLLCWLHWSDPAPGITGRGWVPVNPSLHECLGNAICYCRALGSWVSPPWANAKGVQWWSRQRAVLSDLPAAVHSPACSIPGAMVPSQHLWKKPFAPQKASCSQHSALS